MIEESDIEKLAVLARLDLALEEKQSLKTDLGKILDYVSELKRAPVSDVSAAENSLVKNVMREDGSAHETGLYTEKILQAAPETANGFIKVKKILG